MEMISAIFAYLVLNGPALLAALNAVLLALIALFLLIPGEQPEKALRSVADFLEKFSKK